MKLTPRDRALLGVVAALLLCAAFYELVLTPERRTASHLQTQIAAAQTSLARAQQQEASGHAAEVALRTTQPDWSAAKRAVPRVANVPALLKLLQRNAVAAHVSMQSISLSGASASSTSAGTTTTGAASTAATGPTTIPVSLTFYGGYQALNRLLARLNGIVTLSHRRLRSHGPLIGIGAVNLAPNGGTSNPSQLSVQLTATIYQHAAASTAATTGATG